MHKTLFQRLLKAVGGLLGGQNQAWREKGRGYAVSRSASAASVTASTGTVSTTPTLK